MKWPWGLEWQAEVEQVQVPDAEVGIVIWLGWHWKCWETTGRKELIYGVLQILVHRLSVLVKRSSSSSSSSSCWRYVYFPSTSSSECHATLRPFSTYFAFFTVRQTLMPASRSAWQPYCDPLGPENLHQFRRWGALHGLGDAKAESPLERPVQRGWLRSFQVAVQTTFTLWQTAFWFNGLMKTKDGQDGQSANLRAKNRHKMMCCMSTAGWSGAPSHSSKGSPYIFAFCMFARGCFVEGTVIILWSYYVALCCTRQYGYCVLYCVSSVSIFGILDVNCESIITD